MHTRRICSAVPLLGLILLVPLPNQSYRGGIARTVQQDCPADIDGAWHGTLNAGDLFSLRLTLTEQAPGTFQARIESHQGVERGAAWRDGERLRFQSARLPIAFDGIFQSDSGAIDGFMQHGSILTHTRFVREESSVPRAWTTDWNLLGVPVAKVPFDLYIEREDDGSIGGYFFFRDQRLPALWGYGLSCQGDTLQLREKNLGLRFAGRFDRAQDALVLKATGLGGSVPLTFRRMEPEYVPDLPDAPELPPRAAGASRYESRAPQAIDDGWPTAKPEDEGLDVAPIRNMVRAIVEQEITFTHSVLVARHGRLVVEEYFYGFDRDTWHDMRSASKTVTSALIGLAIDRRLIDSVGAPALGFFSRYRRYDNWDPRKARITIRDLLRMASGLDANDSDPRSVASEGAYQSQAEQPDWIKLALDAPMIADPGAQSLYGGANPLILGGILNETVPEPVEWFADRALFGPLGIHSYKFFADPTGIPYMGGGMYLRPRDMAKFGQLYLDGGVWRGKRVISEAWVRESTGKYGRLAPLDRNGHQYGYLWWHHQYPVGDRVIETIEARGNGGQYIFVVPSLDVVAVITSGNFRNGRTRQPEEIMRRFILPAVLSRRGGP